MSQRAWIIVSGLLWAMIGSLLLYKGITLLKPATHLKSAALIAVVIGWLKARFVLSKTVRRISQRILSLSPPIRFSDVYPKSYLALLALMIALGVMLRWVPYTWRGLIDVAIGSALIYGALFYFRALAPAKSPL